MNGLCDGSHQHCVPEDHGECSGCLYDGDRPHAPWCDQGRLDVPAFVASVKQGGET